MRTFLIFFFTLYSVFHLYAFIKIRSAFSLNWLSNIAVVLFMFVMVSAPVLVRFLEHSGLELFARTIAYIGYTWMGILFLFVSFSLVIDICRLLFYTGNLIFHKDFSAMIPTSKTAFLLPLIISIAISIYGYFEAKNIRVEKIILKTPKIPGDTVKLKIVQISDVHLGLIVREERLKRILEIVKSENPDILISTGDLVDGQIDSLIELVDMFREIKPRYGKYAITGNHEFYAGLERAINFTEKAGFTVLRGEKTTAGGIINIAGVDDAAGKFSGLYRDVSEKELLTELPQDKFIILLKHRPIVDKSAEGLFDLQLSGHVHKGQIFPFSIITGLYYETQAGKARLPGNSLLYVSRGTGTWGPPIRFLSPPEVTVIELIHDSQ